MKKINPKLKKVVYVIIKLVYSEKLDIRKYFLELFPEPSCEDEGKDEKALIWASQFCILIG